MQDNGSDAQREALASNGLVSVAERELCKIEDLFGHMLRQATGGSVTSVSRAAAVGRKRGVERGKKNFGGFRGVGLCRLLRIDIFKMTIIIIGKTSSFNP